MKTRKESYFFQTLCFFNPFLVLRVFSDDLRRKRSRDCRLTDNEHREEMLSFVEVFYGAKSDMKQMYFSRSRILASRQKYECLREEGSYSNLICEGSTLRVRLQKYLSRNC